MDSPMDQQIADALIELVSTTGEDYQYPDEAHLLRHHKDRFYELYKTNGLIASLTHRVLMNRVVAHYFVVVLRDLRELWLEEEVQLAFADGLRGGNTLLVDAISFVREYRELDIIREAIAFNIASCESILFQVHVVCAGLGLCHHPQIKRAILARREDILESIRRNWHHAALVAYVPYLAEDEDFHRAFVRAKPRIIESIRQDKSLIDAAIMVKRFAWIREDSAVIEALCDRIRDESKDTPYSMLRTLRELDMFLELPELKATLNRFSPEERNVILGL
jgi:hypothetical protein